MRTDEFGCEVFERKAGLRSGARFYFFGTAAGVVLIIGLGVSDTVLGALGQGDMATVVTGAAPSDWQLPIVRSGTVLRVSSRLPTLIGAEAQIWHELNTKLSSILTD